MDTAYLSKGLLVLSAPYAMSLGIKSHQVCLLQQVAPSAITDSAAWSVLLCRECMKVGAVKRQAPPPLRGMWGPVDQGLLPFCARGLPGAQASLLLGDRNNVPCELRGGTVILPGGRGWLQRSDRCIRKRGLNAK